MAANVISKKEDTERRKRMLYAALEAVENDSVSSHQRLTTMEDFSHHLLQRIAMLRDESDTVDEQAEDMS